MNGCVLALDVGGTFIKSGLVGEDGSVKDAPPVPVDAKGPATAIIGSFAEVLRGGLRTAGGRAVRVGVAIPGPFDYGRGVSLMSHKFGAIKDLDLVDGLRKALPELAEMPFRFRHDANAFLAGEMWLGAARGAGRVIGVTLGTGLGVSCCLDGVFLTNKLGSPSADVSVWNRPYKGGTVEDIISTAALVARYCRAHSDYPVERGVKGIAESAKRGEAGAVRLFEELGEELGAVLLPLCERFAPERIVFGGQIAKDFDLFGPALEAALTPAGKPQAVSAGLLGTHAALLGATLDECRAEEGELTRHERS